MKPRPLVNHHALPTWAASAPLTSRDMPNAAVNARGCIRRRSWTSSRDPDVAGPGASLLGDRQEGSVRTVDGHRCYAVAPLSANEIVGGGASSEQDWTEIRDGKGGLEDGCPVDSLKTVTNVHETAHVPAPVDDPNTRYNVISAVASRLEGNLKGRRSGQEEHTSLKDLTPAKLLQQGLIHRLGTLEERRDWRGVMAALVSVQIIHACTHSKQKLLAMLFVSLSGFC